MYGATAGKTAILRIEAATNQAICAIFPRNGSFEPEFLQFYLIHSRPSLLRRRSGGAQPNISQTVISSLEVFLPALPEQRAIARALRAVQEAKEARQQELALERERKASLMDFLFTHGTRGEPRRMTEVGEIPESWRVLPLGQIVRLQRGRDLPVQDRKAGPVPVIGSNGTVGWHDRYPEGVPIPGVTVGRSGSIGLLSYADAPYWPLNTVLYVSNFSGNDPLFIYYWLHVFPFEKYGQGVSVPTLNRNLVHVVPFRLPDVREQHEIARLFRACDTKIDEVEREITLIDELFRAMLEELMTGRLSAVPLIEQEAAS
jgi:type I restriction enzyme S subunit